MLAKKCKPRRTCSTLGKMDF